MTAVASKKARKNKKKKPAKKVTVQDALEAIRAANPQGKLFPAEVVEAAKDPRSPLHARFTWDDGEAAHLYRLHQARALIRCAVTVLPGNTQPVRALVSLTTDRPHKGEGGYRLTEDVLRSRDLTAQLLEDAMSELRAFQKKYSGLKSLAPVFAAIDQVATATTAQKKQKARA